METGKTPVSSKGRALWHVLFGISAIIFGQILSLTDEVRIKLAYNISLWVVGLDWLRLLLYHLLVKSHFGVWLGKRPEEEWKIRTLKYCVWIPFRGLKEIFLFLEKWLLLKSRVLRDRERGFFSTATPFALGVNLPIQMGVPLYAVMNGIIILGFGDPAAREIGLKWGKDKVFKKGKKTWQGFRGFCAFAAVGVVISGLIDLAGCRVYPQTHFIMAVLGFTFAILIGGLVELVPELVKQWTRRTEPRVLRRLIRLLFDDNLLIPVAASVMIVLFIGGSSV